MKTMVEDDAPAPDPTQPEQVRGRDVLRDRIAVLATQAQREIAVFAPRYDRELFSSVRLSEALARFVVRHRQNRARFLIEDADQLARDNERLLELARRFADVIDIHEVAEEHRGSRDMFVVVDKIGFVYQEDTGVAAGVVHVQGKREANTLLSRFEELWTHSSALSGRFGVGR